MCSVMGFRTFECTKQRQSHHRKADQVRIGVPSGEFGSFDSRDISSALSSGGVNRFGCRRRT